MTDRQVTARERESRRCLYAVIHTHGYTANKIKEAGSSLKKGRIIKAAWVAADAMVGTGVLSLSR
jgi:hypothetical protein